MDNIRVYVRDATRRIRTSGSRYGDSLYPIVPATPSASPTVSCRSFFFYFYTSSSSSSSFASSWELPKAGVLQDFQILFIGIHGAFFDNVDVALVPSDVGLKLRDILCPSKNLLFSFYLSYRPCCTHVLLKYELNCDAKFRFTFLRHS